MSKLYGNGINDDTAAIQEMLDSGMSEVYLEAPEKFYLISKTLKIHSNQTIRMSPTTVIKLADGSDCCMLENADFDCWSENICVDGGIWDCNNINQTPNPFHFPDKNGKKLYQNLGMTSEYKNDFEFREKVFHTFTKFPSVYTGIGMRFCRIKGFTLKNIVIKNPVIFGAQLGYIEEFTIRDIRFDYKVGNPKLWNMDGIHIEGNCKNGYISNLQGTCHDDLLAMTSDDSLYGPIENIVVDGIIAENAHSAVRLLSWGIPIKNITIKNVFGSYYVYCIGITRYYGDGSQRGVMENIVLENISAQACHGTRDVAGGNYPVIWIQDGLDIDGLTVKNVYRDEKTYHTPLFKLDNNAKVKRLYIDNIVQKNHLDCEIPFIVLDGEVEDYTLGFNKEYKM